ncbi:hypothetical protein [uncultured Ramlibacter sp.]|uniref:hypothetical protein n=1 Tax=uncultured Ramlibacter sp. TaxID=260755 RepID=UPI002607A915|nr:hypothetical protein [uncultured Ramlibacter sp.]
MLRKTAFATFFIAPFVQWTGATAQNVYKCGHSYSQQPCAGGSAVQAGDARSPEQKAQADAATRRDAKTADAMEKERVKQEARPAQVSIPPPRPQADAPSAKAKKPEVFKASAPAQPDAKPQKKKTAKKEG